MKEEKIEFSLEKVDETNGKFFFTAKSLTKDFECEKGLKIIAKKNINKDLIWRHKHPIQEGEEETHVYGTVVESSYEDGSSLTKYEVYGHTQDHLNFRDLIRERIKINDPLSISMRYRKYFDDDGNIIHYDVFEHSGTPFPKCKKCKSIEYIGEKEMPDEKEKEQPKVLDEKELEEQKGKIEELEASLNSKTKTLEEFKSKIETLEAELMDKSKETLTLEQRVEKLEKSKEDLEMAVDYFKKKPILDEMFELKKKLDKDEKDFYLMKPQDYLEKKLEEWKSQSTTEIVTETLDESAQKSKEKMDEQMKNEKNEKNEVSFEKFSALLSPKIREAYEKHYNKK